MPSPVRNSLAIRRRVSWIDLPGTTGWPATVIFWSRLRTDAAIIFSIIRKTSKLGAVPGVPGRVPGASHDYCDPKPSIGYPPDGGAHEGIPSCFVHGLSGEV